MVDLILFSSSFFSISKVDEDLQTEYDEVKGKDFSKWIKVLFICHARINV